MPTLTCRREKDRHQECWHVFYGDVQVGTISERAGVSVEVDQWGWTVGFHPVIERGLRAIGTAASFEKARADFAAAWQDYLPWCTDLDFEEYRRQRAWTRWKYAMQDSGCKLPSQVSGLSSQCFCGAVIDCATMDQHVFTAHIAAQDDSSTLPLRHAPNL
jgi:hypothetical protein